VIDSVVRAKIVEDRILVASGMTKEDADAWVKNQSSQALKRMKELNISEPWLSSHPNVVEIDRGKTCRCYRVLISKSTGFKKTPQVLLVMSSVIVRSDKLWYHVSVSNSDRVPNYSELVLVKNIFIGEDNQAIQIFPAKKDHVNDHPNCLHLWQCLEENPLPNFAVFGSI
jgi:hypothetical protein